MSDQISPIKTPAHSGGAFSRNENSSLCHFTPRKKIALQLAVSLWIAGGLLGAPGIAAAQETVVNQDTTNDVYGNNSNPDDSTSWDTRTADPNNNRVTVNAGVTVSGDVMGSQYRSSSSGYGNDNVTNNAVILNGTARNVYGGYSGGRDASENKVTISGGTVNYSVYGGKSALNWVVENTVEISAGTIKDSVYGGYTVSGAAEKNTIEISGGTIGTGATSEVYGGRGSYRALENKVTISGGTLTGQVCGGYVTDIYANAKDNTVTISGGTLTGQVYGGYASNSNTTATGNTVTISGGTINGDVNGGFASIATGNTVNILTQLAVQGLYGGIGTTSSGNTLNLAAKGVTATEVSYFQNLNFYLPTDMTKNDTMLTVNGTANVDGATVGVLAQGPLTKLKNGDTITLLKANTLSGTITPGTIATAKIPTGITTVDTYTFNIVQDNNAKAITATVDGISTPGGGDNNNTPGEENNNSNNNSPAGGDNNADSVTAELQANTKSMVETRAASTTMLNGGTDLLAGQGFQQAANAIAQAAESGDGQSTARSLMPFAAIGTGKLRAESGSYVDTRSWALNAGFAKEITNRQGKLLFGPVVEYGRGSYDSYLDNGTHGQGDSSYWGVGFMAKQMNHDGLYYEGSLRGGKIKADYQGNVNTLNVDYDSSSNYLAAHLGLGKVSRLSKSNTLDCYAKYFYSHQSGDSVTMHAAGVPDEAYEFDSVSSHRLRLGLRFTHALNQRQDIYAGLAYQYEFDGEARATYNGTSTPSPSVKGSSVMMELGFRTKVSSNMDLDLSVNGWAGKQRGLNAQLGMQWKF